MKNFLKSLVFVAVLTAGVGAPALQVLHAQTPDAVTTMAPTDTGAEDSGAILLNGLEMVSMLLAVIAIVILISIIRHFGASAISIVFGYFIVGTVLLASARLFILLASLSVLPISEDTLNLGWHLLFFLSMITFFIAGMGFAKMGTGAEITNGTSKVIGWGLISGILMVLIFIMAPIIDAPFTAYFADSFANHIGILHLIAFILGGIAAFYLYQNAKLGQVTALLATPYLVSFGLLALNHFWELLTESWAIIVLPGSTIERVEQIFVLPAFALITYAYIRLWTLVSQRA